MSVLTKASSGASNVNLHKHKATGFGERLCQLMGGKT